MLWLEPVAVAFGLANIVLLLRRSIWNFPFGIATVSLYALIFFEKRLYGEAGLQIFFAVVQLYGWLLWARAGGVREAVAVSWAGWPVRIAALAGIAFGTAMLGTIMHRLTDAAMPYPDAFITSASIAAQLLLSFRLIENWLLWIVIDIVAVGLYLTRDLTLTAGLYTAFLVLSMMGFREWIKAESTKTAPA